MLFEKRIVLMVISNQREMGYHIRRCGRKYFGERNCDMGG